MISDWLTEGPRTETTRVGAAVVLNKERSVATTIRVRAWMERCVARIRTRVPCLRTHLLPAFGAARLSRPMTGRLRANGSFGQSKSKTPRWFPNEGLLLEAWQ